MTAEVRLVDADELRRRIEAVRFGVVIALASGVPAWIAVAMVLGSVAWLAPNEWRKR